MRAESGEAYRRCTFRLRTFRPCTFRHSIHRMTYDPPVPWSPSGPNEQPSTLPKDSQGQAINEDRRERKAREAEFEAKHGRKMSKKDRKRLRGS